MSRLFKHLGAGCVVALLALTNAKAQDQRFDITVTADATKTNGSPWDGVPRLGNSKINLNAAPDIAVCLVRANAKPDCLWKPQGRRLLSQCQNAWACKFDNIALGPLPIGLVFVDIDARNHDIIDLVMLTDRDDAKANDEIADSLRTAMSVLTPHRSEDTKEHLVRAAKLLPLTDCAGGKPCRLTQSQFTLTRR
ncbi:hypothetical protein CSIRO_2712 [Bradyrhizobiaceae bacterium SG-6C]|nr:hypothetical protein CSIRO_2712 [Bradyrhizobiaceae bacterium SG-6C]